jgi:hypothetical protein
VVSVQLFAEDGYPALMNGEMHVVSSITNKIQAMLSSITPNNLVAVGMCRMFEEQK